MFRDLGKCEVAQGGSKPPNWENKPERFMLLKRLCDYTLFQLKKEKEQQWLVKGILRIQIRGLRKHLLYMIIRN